MAQNIAASSASSATKSFFGGITGTLGVVVGLIVVLLLCCGGVALLTSSNGNNSNSTTNTTNNSQQPDTNTKAPVEPVNVTYSGKGNKDTESFTVHDGTAKMTATTTGGSYGTYSSITLQKEGENTFLNGLTGEDLNISTDGAEDGHGDTTIRGLTEGTYYVHVISGVSWTVTITQE